MPLPVLSGSAAMGAGELLRQAAQVEVRWSGHLADAVTTDAGQVFASAALPLVPEANCVLDTRPPSIDEAPALVAEAEAVFTAAGSRCLRWALPSGNAPGEWTDRLRQMDYTPRSARVYHLRRHAPSPPGPAGDLKILSARAASGPYADFARQESPSEQAAQAKLLHLDDGHYEVLVALSAGRVHASVGVYAMGEIGAIREWRVAQPHRRRGLGRLMLERALDNCARSLFRHVLITSADPDAGVDRLLHRSGFVPVGELPRMERH